MTKVVFRTDASESIGTGHVVRCLTLADILKQQGASCFFATGGDSLKTVPKLASSGYGIIDPENIEDSNVDLLIVDHYKLDSSYTRKAKSWAKKIAVIDDINVQFHHCDYLICQNPVFTGEDYAENMPENAMGFFGPEYLLLRPQFIVPVEKIRTRTVPPQNVLMFFGGIDAFNYTTRFLKIFEELSFTGKLVVVAGAANPYLEEIKLLCARMSADLHVQTDNMAQLMMAADMAIGCGGTAIWERLALNLPSMDVIHSDFQIPVLNQLDRAGYLHCLGEMKNLDNLDIRNAIERALAQGLGITPCRCGTETGDMVKTLLAG